MARLQLVDDDGPNSTSYRRPAATLLTVILVIATAVTVLAVGATVLGLAARDVLIAGAVVAWTVYAVRLGESSLHRRMDRIERRVQDASYHEGYVEGYMQGVRRELPKPSHRAVRPV
ncbi:hypothetical protein EDC02_6360 [Micromonospora sp. Llam0]|uniref:hypothetical protein n=1 Tax=Micromonospora sp. Llam0 TaxID=2485143 RepID=UPI000FBC1633|nr:hypothetical protein [Micromonospora sp. Llam0]ROO51481.1 hypothetical protein EDC02_6360 [Micromonospora sp. Llam0]